MNEKGHIESFELRISALPRLAYCTGFMGMPRVNDFKTTLPKPVQGTPHMYGSEYGTFVHKLVEDQELEHPWRKGDGQHEVRVAYSYQPLPDDATYWTDASRPTLTYFTGTADFIGYDVSASFIIGDIKTSETIEQKQFIQLAGYAAALPAGVHPKVESLQIWRIRNHTWKLSRLHKDIHPFKPPGKLISRAKAIMDRAIRVKLGLEAPEIKPGDHCGFCPARFHCEGYNDYVESNQDKGGFYRYLVREQRVYQEFCDDFSIDPVARAEELKVEEREAFQRSRNLGVGYEGGDDV